VGDGVEGGYQRFAATFAAADRNAIAASAGLSEIAMDSTQPAIVRGSALERLATAGSLDAAAAAGLLSDSSPIVRRAALAALEHADEATRLGLAPRLLKDPIRTVRMQAAICLADLADRSLSGSVRADFDRAFDEFVAEQDFNADRPEAHANLGQVLLARGRTDAARAAFRTAIAIDPAFVPAYVNLADVYRAEGNESAATDTLRESIRKNPGSAASHHAIGLAFVRQHRMQEALDELGQAVALDRTDARYSYVYGVALHDTGSAARALTILADSVARHPEDRDTLTALVTYAEEAGRRNDARRYAAKLIQLDRPFGGSGVQRGSTGFKGSREPR
jgi:tetratricopeptide (TPR) repeat protein